MSEKKTMKEMALDKFYELQSQEGWKKTISQQEVIDVFRMLQRYHQSYQLFDEYIKQIDKISNRAMRNEPFLMSIIGYDSNAGADKAVDIVMGKYRNTIPAASGGRTCINPLIEKKVEEYYRSQEILDISKKLIEKYDIKGFEDNDEKVRKLIDYIGVRDENYKIFKENQDNMRGFSDMKNSDAFAKNIIEFLKLKEWCFSERNSKEWVSDAAYGMLVEKEYVHHKNPLSINIPLDIYIDNWHEISDKITDDIIKNLQDVSLTIHEGYRLLDLRSGWEDPLMDPVKGKLLKNNIHFKNPDDEMLFDGGLDIFDLKEILFRGVRTERSDDSNLLAVKEAFENNSFQEIIEKNIRLSIDKNHNWDWMVERFSFKRFQDALAEINKYAGYEKYRIPDELLKQMKDSIDRLKEETLTREKVNELVAEHPDADTFTVPEGIRFIENEALRGHRFSTINISDTVVGIGMDVFIDDCARQMDHIKALLADKSSGIAEQATEQKNQINKNKDDMLHS